ncbi:UNVERIFIED_CONTAM: hypothetical protein HDU68_010539 [Siphonaria sp. JEL0065]|nr:hypothetical protein HDU68_010539 [Siphonaria sp. JEL0065]
MPYKALSMINGIEGVWGGPFRLRSRGSSSAGDNSKMEVGMTIETCCVLILYLRDEVLAKGYANAVHMCQWAENGVDRNWIVQKEQTSLISQLTDHLTTSFFHPPSNISSSNTSSHIDSIITLLLHIPHQQMLSYILECLSVIPANNVACADRLVKLIKRLLKMCRFSAEKGGAASVMNSLWDYFLGTTVSVRKVKWGDEGQWCLAVAVLEYFVSKLGGNGVGVEEMKGKMRVWIKIVEGSGRTVPTSLQAWAR